MEPLIQPVVNLIGLVIFMMAAPLLAMFFSAMGMRLIWYFAFGDNPS